MPFAPSCAVGEVRASQSRWGWKRPPGPLSQSCPTQNQAPAGRGFTWAVCSPENRMQKGLRECSSHDGVYFEERLLLVLLRAIFVKVKSIFQNTWKNTTLPSREIPHAGISAGNPIILSVAVHMHLLTEMIWLHSLFLEVPQPQEAEEGAGMCFHMCSLTLHPASAFPSAPATSSILSFPACRPYSPCQHWLCWGPWACSSPHISLHWPSGTGWEQQPVESFVPLKEFPSVLPWKGED